MKQQEQGFSALELAICFILLVALYGVLSSKLSDIAEDAEKASVQAMLGELQRQINLRNAKLYIDPTALDPVSNSLNPFAWSNPPPESYGGELLAAKIDNAKAGFWYFIRDRQQILYRVKHPQREKTSGQSSKYLLFKLDLHTTEPVQLRVAQLQRTHIRDNKLALP